MLIASAMVLIALATPVFSQTAADTSSKDSAKRDDVSLLKQQIAEQQKQIEQLRTIVDQMKQRMDQSPNPAQTATTQAPNLGQVASTSPMVPKATEKSSAGSDGNLVASTLIPSAAVPSATPAPAQKEEADKASPLQFHIGTASIIPVGFMDFTSVYRNHDTNGSIATNFGSIPYASSSAYAPNLSEFRLSTENSRIGFRVDADVKGVHVIGYMEADFHGNNATNVAETTNSNTLRERQYWVDLNTGHFEVLGGQIWSLMTPGRTGISPIPADIFYTQVIDVNYQAGLVFGRIPELRFVYHPSKQVAFAIALDSPDQYAGGNGGSGTIVLPAALNTSATYQGELDYGSGNTLSTPNRAPDIIAKLAFDPVKQVHLEIGGVARSFKVYYPGVAATSTVAAIPASTFSAEGAGGFLNFSVEPVKGLRLLTNNYWSDGGGRYIYGEAPDLIAHADGSISLIHSGSTVTGFELTHKKTVIYAYYGGIYIGRNTAIDTNGKLVGYGYTGSANSQNRIIQEATFGINQTLWKHAKYGALIFMGQYSYLTRSPWYVASGQPANASINMLFFNLRYSLPGSAPTLGKQPGD
ncbi:MAG: hypothetical protein WCD04_15910 [Terriglobia bacterium]|jgi:uncharacterized coiled-coil protein SlyX